MKIAKINFHGTKTLHRVPKHLMSLLYTSALHDTCYASNLAQPP